MTPEVVFRSTLNAPARHVGPVVGGWGSLPVLVEPHDQEEQVCSSS